LYNELLQDSYLTQNVSDLSGIIALGSLKLNIDWHSVTICISLVLNNFIKNRLIGKSSDLILVLLKGQTSRPNSKIGRHLVLISSRITSSDAILSIVIVTAYYVYVFILTLCTNYSFFSNTTYIFCL